MKTLSQIVKENEKPPRKFLQASVPENVFNDANEIRQNLGISWNQFMTSCLEIIITNERESIPPRQTKRGGK